MSTTFVLWPCTHVLSKCLTWIWLESRPYYILILHVSPSLIVMFENQICIHEHTVELFQASWYGFHIFSNYLYILNLFSLSSALSCFRVLFDVGLGHWSLSLWDNHIIVGDLANLLHSNVAWFIPFIDQKAFLQHMKNT